MSRRQRQTAVLALLLVVCAIVYGRAMRRPSVQVRAAVTQEGVPSRGTTAEMFEPARPASARGQRDAQRERAKLLGWGRDPFLAGNRESASGLRLSGILWDPAHPLAVIGEEALMVGQTVEGWRVVEIQPGGVVLERDSRRQLLTPGKHLPSD